jgi:hypothetical protein
MFDSSIVEEPLIVVLLEEFSLTEALCKNSELSL